MENNTTGCKHCPKLPAQVLPSITTYPVDGYGGSYYDYLFAVPIYTRNSDMNLKSTSWQLIDEYYKTNCTKAIGSAVVFGICTATLLNVILLTPQHRRKLPLHSFTCLALACQIMRHIIDLVGFTKSVPASSYICLTEDIQSMTISRIFYALVALSQVFACLSFVFVQACFFVQGRALMTWLHIHHRRVYYSVLVYLITTGVVALTLRIGSAVYQSRYPFADKAYDIDEVFLRGSVIAYAISIGSWSAVFFASAISIIITRRRSLVNNVSVYDLTLNLISIIGLESFIVPILFCVMQFPNINWLVSSETFIVPSVLFLLPVGGLFIAAHSTSPSTGGGEKHPPVRNTVKVLYPDKPKRDAVAPVSQQVTDLNPSANIQETRIVKLPVPSSFRGGVLHAPRKIPNVFDAELALIDALVVQEPDGGTVGDLSDGTVGESAQNRHN